MLSGGEDLLPKLDRDEIQNKLDRLLQSGLKEQRNLDRKSKLVQVCVVTDLYRRVCIRKL